MKKENKVFYVSTPIYYPNDKLHIGHAYSTILADFLARYKKQEGYNVFFSTGSDEHGQKIETKSKEMNQSPMEYVTKIVKTFKDLWEKLGIDYDIFIRTTDKFHMDYVQQSFSKLLSLKDKNNKPYIYLGFYEDFYCHHCEAYYTDKQLDENKHCPFCHRPVKNLKEESYFLATTLFKDWAIENLEKGNLFPKSRVNELLNNFLNENFTDLSISRSNFSWGIPIKENPKHVIYVWLDALLNYVSVFKSPDRKNKLTIEEVWSKNLNPDSEIVHIVGKEITRFHSIYWPIMLEMLGFKQPKVLAHGWILMDDQKMSKSLGNIIDPNILIEKYGRDVIRFYMLKINIENDGSFSENLLLEEFNSILVNKYSNLVHRTLTMLKKYFNNKIPKLSQKNSDYNNAKNEFEKLSSEYKNEINNFNFADGIKNIIKIMDLLNGYIEITKPWTKSLEEQKTIFNFLMNKMFKLNILLKPILIDGTKKFFSIFPNKDKEENIEDLEIDSLEPIYLRK